MISALFYLQIHSFRNRLVRWAKRLRQPKYLAAAVVGGAYFYFYFFRYLLRGNGLVFNPLNSPENLALLETFAAFVLLVVVLLAWIIPHERAALTFSEAEVAFLFPAPVTRRTLIHFKLLRSQSRILFTVLFLTLFSNRFGGNAWIHAAGWWLLLSTLNLHFLGSSFARTLLLDRGISNGLRRCLFLAAAAGFVGAIVIWTRRTLPTFHLADVRDAQALLDYARQALESSAALPWLYPFRLLVRPYLASTAGAFLSALGPALVLFLLHYAWVVRSNVAFEEASVAASEKLAARAAAVRSGNLQAAREKKARRSPFPLAPAGPQPTALFWKNLISAGQFFTLKFGLRLAAIVVIMLAASLGTGVRHGNGIMVAGMTAAVFAVWSLLFGPQILRQDLRQDLPLADVLKTYPMRGWQIVLGELLAPVVILLVVQWLLLAFAAVGCARLPAVDPALVFAVVAGAAILLPGVDMILFLIPNAAVLLFPGWVQAGKERPRGIEATGQRLIFMIGQLLTLGVAMIPACLVFLLAFFPLRLLAGPPWAIVAGACVTMLVLAVESGLGVWGLGRLLERLDVSAELPD